ncbi:hypothetical protein ES704_01375 [subsurface metagenome]|jgi:hypothetical protein
MKNPEQVDLEEKVKQLVLQQIQLDKGMPILKPLDPEVEGLIIGTDDPRGKED